MAPKKKKTKEELEAEKLQAEEAARKAEEGMYFAQLEVCCLKPQAKRQARHLRQRRTCRLRSNQSSAAAAGLCSTPASAPKDANACICVAERIKAEHEEAQRQEDERLRREQTLVAELAREKARLQAEQYALRLAFFVVSLQRRYLVPFGSVSPFVLGNVT